MFRRREGATAYGSIIKHGPINRVAAVLRVVVCLAAAWAWSDGDVERLTVNVQRAIPHDTEAFTQGLLWAEGKLYESTGRRGRSELRELDPDTGRVARRVPISRMYFGEGLAQHAGRLVMLTWHAERAYVFATDDFRRLDVQTYRGEGWGLCHDGERFVMSDGSDRLTFRDTDSFAAMGSVAVTLDGRPLANINELECVGGSIYANVFQSDSLARIDPVRGHVTQLIDASGLLTRDQAASADVLNGIAFNPDSGRFTITGKLWPLMFEVTFE